MKTELTSSSITDLWRLKHHYSNNHYFKKHSSDAQAIPDFLSPTAELISDLFIGET